MAQPANWPRVAEVSGSLRHDLALKEASRETPNRGLDIALAPVSIFTKLFENEEHGVHVRSTAESEARALRIIIKYL